jgi:hypothetical protein
MAEQQPVFTPVEDTTDDGKAAIYDAATNKVVWAAAGSPPPMPATNSLLADISNTTHYLTTPIHGPLTTTTMAADTMYLAPLYVGSSFTASEMAFRMGSDSGTGSTMRCLLYADNGAGKPGARLIYSSAVTTELVTFDKSTVSVSASLTPGLYWIGGIHRWVGSAGTISTTSASDHSALHLWNFTTTWGGWGFCFTWTEVTGTPPDPAGTPGGLHTATGPPLFGIR